MKTTKSSFFEETNKIDKPLATFTKEKRERTQTKSEIKKKLPQTPEEYKGSYKDTVRDPMTPNSTT